MARDFEDVYYLDSMSDDEIRDLVVQELNEYPEVDAELVDVNVNNGAVTLSGRVGTDREIQQIERVLTDVIGVKEVRNEIVLDELARGEQSEDAEEAMRGGPVNTSDEAAHLMEDIDADQFGTDNPQTAVERGTAYEPPEGPPSEGTWSREQH